MVRGRRRNEGRKPGHSDFGGYILEKFIYGGKGCATAAPGALPPIVVVVQVHEAEFQTVCSDVRADIVEQLNPSGLGIETLGPRETPEAADRCAIRGQTIGTHGDSRCCTSGTDTKSRVRL